MGKVSSCDVPNILVSDDTQGIRIWLFRWSGMDVSSDATGDDFIYNIGVKKTFRFKI